MLTRRSLFAALAGLAATPALAQYSTGEPNPFAFGSNGRVQPPPPTPPRYVPAPGYGYGPGPAYRGDHPGRYRRDDGHRAGEGYAPRDFQDRRRFRDEDDRPRGRRYRREFD